MEARPASLFVPSVEGHELTEDFWHGFEGSVDVLAGSIYRSYTLRISSP
jgi:hypothetical protein